jgi:hypothetical protein
MNEDGYPWSSAVAIKRLHIWLRLDKPGHSFDGHCETACGGIWRLPTALFPPDPQQEKCIRCAKMEREDAI